MPLYIWLTYSIGFLSVGLFVYGIYLAVKIPLGVLHQSIIVQQRIQKAQQRSEKESRAVGIDKFTLSQRITLTLQAVHPDWQQSSIETLKIMYVVLVSMVGVLLGLITESIVYSALVLFSLSFVIYASYMMGLRNIRVEASYDLAKITGILSSKYRMTGQNMSKTLQYAWPEIENAAIKKSLFEISRVEQRYVSSNELKEIIDAFVFTINTAFAKQIGVTTFKALTKKTNVEETLVLVDKAIQKNILEIQQGDDAKYEILALSKFHWIGFPVTLFVIIPLAVSGLHGSWTLHEMIDLQFQDPTGRWLF